MTTLERQAISEARSNRLEHHIRRDYVRQRAEQLKSDARRDAGVEMRNAILGYMREVKP